VQVPANILGDRATFGRSARVTSSEIFALAIKSRPLVRGHYFFLHFLKRSDCEPALGLIVPKRLLKKATSRNSVKRVVREAFRQLQHSLPKGDFVIRLKAAPAPGSLTILKRTLRDDIEVVLRKASSTP
jgi:ribonuclease P protein component